MNAGAALYIAGKAENMKAELEKVGAKVTLK